MIKINNKIKLLIFALAIGLLGSSMAFADDYYGWRGFKNSAFNNEIKSIEVYNGDMIAGGKFSAISGVPTHGIARWNGSNWVSIGAVKNTEIYAMTVWNGSLVAAGKFNTINGITAKNIARWNGTNWVALGAGLNNDVYTLTTFNGNLIAGGKFTSSGSTQTKRVAVWDGSSWKESGNGLGNDVYSLIVWNDDLIAGGSFSGKVAELNGSNWEKVGFGLTDDVLALSVFDGKLIAGGKFFRHLAQLDNGIWWVLGSGVENDVNSLQNINGKLVLGGKFRYVGNILNGLYVNRIASWDGSSYGKYSSGMSGSVNSIKAFDSLMVAVGSFYSAGGDTAYNIAAWKKISLRAITGKVLFRDNNEPVPGGRVFAAKLDIYTKKIVYLDTADVGSVGHQSGEYILDRVPEGEGDLLICFPEDEDDNPSGSSDFTFVPTYYPETTSWITATRLPVNQSLMNINIHVERVPVRENPASILGTLTGKAKLNYTPEGYPTTGEFDYKSGTIIYLKKNGVFYAYDVTNDDEDFLINSIETGQYTLIADRLGYSGITMQLSISTLTNVTFTLDTLSIITNIGTGNGNEIPSKFALYQNYPNPFNPSSKIRFDLPSNTDVKLKVYDIVGREVLTLVDGQMAAGSYEAVWNASSYPSGIYFYSLEAGNFRETKRMVLVK